MSFLLHASSLTVPLHGSRAASCARVGGAERGRIVGGGLMPSVADAVAVDRTNAIRSSACGPRRATSPSCPSPRRARCWCREGLMRASASKSAAAAAVFSVDGEEGEENAPPSTSTTTTTATTSSWPVAPAAFDPSAGLSASQLAALSSAVLESTRGGGSRRRIKVSALAKSTGLDRSVVLQWLRSVDAAFPVSSSSSSSKGGDDDEDNSSSAAALLRESALGAYAAAGLAAEERARAASAARQEERRRKREAAAASSASASDARKRPGALQSGGADSLADVEGTWSSTNRRRRLGRLSKAAEATLRRVFESSRYPSDDVVEGAAELHRGEGLTKRGVLDYLASRRREEEEEETAAARGKGEEKNKAGRKGGGGRGGGGGGGGGSGGRERR